MPETFDPSRRELLFGSAVAPAAEVHVCSLVVHAWPERLDAVSDALRALPGAELHGHDPVGKLIVTLETATEAEIVTTMNAIGDIEGVLSTSLVFHHYEQEQGG
jgi:nitrate reductase NapD